MTRKELNTDFSKVRRMTGVMTSSDELFMSWEEKGGTKEDQKDLIKY